MHPNVAGALINSAIYLLCVFVAGIVTAHPVAWKGALIAMGVTYLSHYAGLSVALGQNRPVTLYLANVAVALSILLGAIAGAGLLF